MTHPPIAVLGGGNGAHALAADAALQGVPVRMYEDPQFEEHFRPTREARKIEFISPTQSGIAPLACATHDMAEALEGVSLINVVTPTGGHPAMFDRLVPLLRPGHKVVVWAGRFGGMRLAKRILDTGVTDTGVTDTSIQAERITVAETNTLPYGTRLTGPAKVTIFYPAVRIFVGALPADRAPFLVEEVRAFCPIARPARDILSAAFRNGAIVVYPAGALFNAGRVERTGGEFYMFREGITPSVARVIRALYGELERVGDALGLDVERYPEEAFDPPHTIEKEEFTDPAGPSDALDALKGPTSIPTRYLYENLRDALAVVAELGRVAGVPTPGMDALIRLGGMLSGEDFWADRQGLETLGLAGLDAAGIRERMTKGLF
ncbi:MAG: NAD/NADP octopine/nopaline dehydrogenase family protein [Nitrospinota bacterium]